MFIRAIASDYDGTIADDGRTEPTTVAALERFKASSRKLILVTGRPLGELKVVFDRLDLFDLVVAENGGLLYFPDGGRERPLAPPPSRDLVDRLRSDGIAGLEVGRTIIASQTIHQSIIARAIDDLKLDLEIILNTDALMVLPAGVDKGSGLRAALAELNLPSGSVAAVGDAENDVAFLRQCGLAVAVGNALPEVKAVANLVMSGERGAGVEELIALLLEQPDRNYAD
ncbi:MAG: HAD family phosphatase [Hyphomicrobiaceae bacterium]|nr:HAD family phosphatase [Hyphomicrobiaceae bacterium]